MNHCRFLLSVAQYGLFGLEMCCHDLHAEKIRFAKQSSYSILTHASCGSGDITHSSCETGEYNDIQ